MCGQVAVACNGHQFSKEAYEYWEKYYNETHDKYYLTETDKDYARQDGKDGKEKVRARPCSPPFGSSLPLGGAWDVRLIGLPLQKAVRRDEFHQSHLWWN